MQKNSRAEWFSNLSASDKTLVLTRIIYYFTLVVRDITTLPFNDMTIRRLRGIGELTHAMAPYMIALSTNNEKRYSDKDLIELLFFAAKDYGLGNAFEDAWQNAEQSTQSSLKL